ncbi:hypothetical protein Cp1R7AA1_126 [Mesorhizobium phage Cp1R7A-A1]|nr:hypothetical protein Cp1R7AA1_126 [Mesorhizobium phage Cp1R7A-A1]
MFKSIIAGLALLASVSVTTAEETEPWAIWPDDHVFDEQIGTLHAITVGCKSFDAALADGKRWIENPENWDTKDNSASCLDLTKAKGKKKRKPVQMMILDVHPSVLNTEATHHLFIVEAVDAKKRIWFTWAFETVRLPQV